VVQGKNYMAMAEMPCVGLSQRSNQAIVNLVFQGGGSDWNHGCSWGDALAKHCKFSVGLRLNKRVETTATEVMVSSSRPQHQGQCLRESWGWLRLIAITAGGLVWTRVLARWIGCRSHGQSHVCSRHLDPTLARGEMSPGTHREEQGGSALGATACGHPTPCQCPGRTGWLCAGSNSPTLWQYGWPQL